MLYVCCACLACLEYLAILDHLGSRGLLEDVQGKQRIHGTRASAYLDAASKVGNHLFGKNFPLIVRYH